MNVLFIYSLDCMKSARKPLWKQELMQFGVSYISAVLREAGHDTRLLVLSRRNGRRNKSIIDEYLKTFEPKLVCVSAVYSEYMFVTNIARYIKSRHPDTFILAGGPHPTLCPEDVIGDGYDAVCVGEGEYPTRELASQLENDLIPTAIPNMWIRSNSSIERNPTRSFIDDVDKLPLPDRGMWQEWISDERADKSVVMLGRGCPYKCTYCCNHAFSELASGKYVRLRSPDNVVGEIHDLVEKMPITREIYFETETIAMKRGWMLELCSKLETLNSRLKVPISYGANLRIGTGADVEELMRVFKNSNFRYLNIGLESGSERVRRDILNRQYTNQDVVDTVRAAKKYGIEICLYNMLGIPGEGKADFWETVKVNRECQPDWHFTSIYYPYPGTDLYALCKKNGYVNESRMTRPERSVAIMDLPGFSRREINRCYTWFDYHVYRGIRPMYAVLDSVIRVWLGKGCYLNNYVLKLYNMVLKSNVLRNSLKTLMKVAGR